MAHSGFFVIDLLSALSVFTLRFSYQMVVGYHSKGLPIP